MEQLKSHNPHICAHQKSLTRMLITCVSHKELCCVVRKLLYKMFCATGATIFDVNYANALHTHMRKQCSRTSIAPRICNIMFHMYKSICGVTYKTNVLLF